MSKFVDKLFRLFFRRGRPTVENTGQLGVFDFLKHFNLSLDDALEISDHLPVWADFSCLEGQSVRRVADEGTANDRLK
jgi:hypothetical protein